MLRPCERQVVERLQQGLELRRVLGQDGHRLRQRGQSAVAVAPLVGRQRGGQAVQAVDGLGDVVGVLRVAGGHRGEVGQECLERGLLPGEALAAGLNDLLEFGRRDGAEDLRSGRDELLDVGDDRGVAR